MAKEKFKVQINKRTKSSRFRTMWHRDIIGKGYSCMCTNDVKIGVISSINCSEQKKISLCQEQMRTTVTKFQPVLSDRMMNILGTHAPKYGTTLLQNDEIGPPKQCPIFSFVCNIFHRRKNYNVLNQQLERIELIPRRHFTGVTLQSTTFVSKVYRLLRDVP